MGILLFILLALPNETNAPLRSAPANWGPGCNNALLEGEFALGKAPDLKVSNDRRSVIDRVVGEMKRNYGGTLVTRRAPDPDIDTPEFVAHYLRAFAELPDGKDLKSYDYRFSRLLARVAKQPAAVEDARLDWDVMRAYLAYENFTDGSSSYRSNEIQGSPVMKSLESARDFLWLFLDQNAEAILKDPPRLQWWVRHLSADLEAPGGRPFRRWFLLQLVAASDPDRSTVASPPKKQADPKTKPMREPSALDPFLIVDLKKSPTPPSFAQALEQMTAPHGLTFEVWGVNPGKLPTTRIKEVPLEMGKWSTDDSHVINQESWSDEKASGYEYGVSLWRLVGSRSQHYSVAMPSEERKDGVFFFVLKKRLYIWPKASMDAGVIQLLDKAALLDDGTKAELRRRGIEALPVTIKSGG